MGCVKTNSRGAGRCQKSYKLGKVPEKQKLHFFFFCQYFSAATLYSSRSFKEIAKKFQQLNVTLLSLSVCTDSEEENLENFVQKLLALLVCCSVS